MSDHRTIVNHLDSNYSDNELLHYTRRNGLYKPGMDRAAMIHATANALHENGYRVGFVKDQLRSPRRYADTSGNAEVALGSRRRSMDLTAGEAEYEQLKETNQLKAYEEEVEAGERSYQHGRHRERRSRHKAGLAPTGPQDCPAGTYFREGYYRRGTMTTIDGIQVPRRGSYVEATCARLPRENEWWEEIHEYAKEHPGTSGAAAAVELSKEMAEGLIPHHMSPRRSRYVDKRVGSPGRLSLGSNNVVYSMSNSANEGAANVGSYGAGLSGQGNASLGSYNSARNM